MHEILFRGRNCLWDWFEGSLHIDLRSLSYRILDLQGEYHYVDKSTVGQYIGRKDKKGKRIFEGDIVKGEDTLSRDIEIFGYVCFKDGSFVISDDLITHYRWIDYEVEVIGNIHDNPELLEREAISNEEGEISNEEAARILEGSARLIDSVTMLEEGTMAASEACKMGADALREIEDVKGVLDTYHHICEGYKPEHIQELLKAENDGRLMVLPCKVGDTVWIIENVLHAEETIHVIMPRKIDGVEGNSLNPIWMVSKEPFELRFHPSEFGKTVFLTKEELEKNLIKINGEGDQKDIWFNVKDNPPEFGVPVLTLDKRGFEKVRYLYQCENGKVYFRPDNLIPGKDITYWRFIL